MTLLFVQCTQRPGTSREGLALRDFEAKKYTSDCSLRPNNGGFSGALSIFKLGGKWKLNSRGYIIV
jgi:hypothetical protein